MDRDGPLGHPGEARERDVLTLEHDVLVDVVGEGERVELDAQAGDQIELGAREHLAGRVVRRVDDDRPGPRAECRAQLVRIDRPVRFVQRDVARDRAGQDRVGAVVLVVGLEHDDLVARVEQPEHGGHHRLGRAAGDGDLGLGVDRAPAGEVARRRRGDRVAQRLAPPGDGVLVDVVGDGGRGSRLELGRAREVGEALGEADRTGRDREPVHLADDRFGEALGLGRDPGRAMAAVYPGAGRGSAWPARGRDPAVRRCRHGGSVATGSAISADDVSAVTAVRGYGEPDGSPTRTRGSPSGTTR